jgi:hypothetical protein
MTKAWEIYWFCCKADASDVEYEKTRNLAKGETRKDLKIGDTLWRVPFSIGPIGIDENHWSGYHLTCSEEEAELVASIPVMVERLAQLERENQELKAKLGEANV